MDDDVPSRSTTAGTHKYGDPCAAACTGGFGLVAVAMAVAGGLELLTLFGFDAALVRRKKISKEHYDSAWTFNLLLGLGLAVALGLPIAYWIDFRMTPIRIGDVVYARWRPRCRLRQTLSNCMAQ